jgi:hypothetical protein
MPYRGGEGDDCHADEQYIVARRDADDEPADAEDRHAQGKDESPVLSQSVGDDAAGKGYHAGDKLSY